MTRVCSLLCALVACCFAPLAGAQVLQVAEMNTTQILALDRAHTVVMLTNGILEEHGPWLPSFIDGYYNEATAFDLARSLVARPGWTVVMFPIIPLGANAASDIGKRWSFPGSYTVLPGTLRAVYMDLADDLGRQGFKHVLIVDSHGGPANSVALDQASDYFHDTYGGRMTHLFGLMPVFEASKALEKDLTPAQQAENGIEVHAGAGEESTALFLRPDLVPEGYRKAESVPATDFDVIVKSAAKPSWPGYLGAPRLATAAIGADNYFQCLDFLKKLTPQILDGTIDVASIARYGATFSKMLPDILNPMLTHDAEVEQQHRKWLAAHTVAAPSPVR